MRFLVLLLFAACVAQPNVVVAPEVSATTFNSTLETYTFSLVHNNKIGIGSIIEHQLVSVKHLFMCEPEEIGSYVDIQLFGKSEVEGLKLCEEPHTAGELVYFYTKENETLGFIRNVDGREIVCASNQLVLLGQSGTPVLCRNHKKVVGMVSYLLHPISRYIANSFQYDGSMHFGVVRLFKEDLE